jgi:hypothetical protein
VFEPGEESLLAEAASAGFRLVEYRTDTGQSVWEWRRGDEPRPQFVTRRVALYWIAQYLDGANRALTPELAASTGRGGSP